MSRIAHDILNTRFCRLFVTGSRCFGFFSVIILSTLVLLSLSALVSADILTISVLDKATGNGLDGATVFLTERNAGGYVSSDGTVSISGITAGSDTLVCRRIGYHEIRMPVSIPDSIVVTMSEELVIMEAVEVVGRRPDEVPVHERTSSSVSVIDREEIPERAITLDEVLDSQLGVDIRSYGGAGSRSDISIRGSTTEQVAVYLDGIPMNAGGSGVSGLTSIPVSQVQNIEVYRGSSPGSFGAGAIGGVVNITTVPAGDGADLSASTSIGSFGTNHQTVAGQIAMSENDRVSLAFDRRASENDFKYFDDRGTYINTSDDGWETRRNADIETIQFDGGWIRHITDEHRFRTSVLYRSTEQGIPGLGRSPAYDARFSLDDILWQGTWESGGWLTAQTWVSHEDRGFYDPSDEVGRMGHQDTDTDIDIAGVQAQVNHVIGATLAHVKFDMRRETYKTSDNYHSDISLPSRRHYLTAGYEHEIVLFNESLWLQPRVNYSRIEDRIQDVSLVVGALADSLRTKIRDVGNAAFGVRYKPTDNLTLRANAGIYSREPDFNELFGDTGDVVGNTALEEERSTNFDAGFHWSIEWFPAEIDVSVFHRYTRDLIQQRSYGDYLKAENIGKAQIDGLEFLMSGQFETYNLFYRLSTAYQRGLNKSDATAFRKKRYYNKFLPYHPEWMIDGVMRMDILSRVRMSWMISFESSCYRGPSNLTDEMIDARLLNDIAFDVDVRDGVSLRAEIVNITDESYVDRWGYPKPGRMYHLSVSWNHDFGDTFD